MANKHPVGLYRQLLLIVVGEDVSLVLKRPENGSDGACTKNKMGGNSIFIDPELSDYEFFRILLHEMSHVFLGHVKHSNKLLKDGISQREMAVIDEIDEKQAWKLAEFWEKLSRPTLDEQAPTIGNRLMRLILYFKNKKENP
jgi:hypothetical protein